jgi:hypothetical protein
MDIQALINLLSLIEEHGIYPTKNELNCIKEILVKTKKDEILNSHFYKLITKLELYQYIKNNKNEDNKNKILNLIDEIDMLWLKSIKWFKKQIININSDNLILKIKCIICEQIINNNIINEEDFIKEIDNYKGILSSYTIRSAKKHFKKNFKIYDDWIELYEKTKDNSINDLKDPF